MFCLKRFMLIASGLSESYGGHIPFTVQHINGFNFHAVAFSVLTDDILKRKAFCHERASVV
jgi:hypothetical protein